MIKQWTTAAAIAAGTAYAIPASAGLPATTYIIGVRNLTIAPLANGTAASVTAPITEVGVANNTTTPSAGDVSVQVAAQKLASGDDIPADAVITVDLIVAGEGTLNP